MGVMVITHCDELCLNVWKWQSIIQAISSISFPIRSYTPTHPPPLLPPLLFAAPRTQCLEKPTRNPSSGGMNTLLHHLRGRLISRQRDTRPDKGRD